jgi:uncharacterized phage protein (TIGR01671 family)
MREILFRGKRSDNGNWICGSLFTRVGEYYIIPLPIITSKSKVAPETVGQFTGQFDKNGKKIFEGDIIKNEYEVGKNQYFQITYNEDSMRWSVMNKYRIQGHLCHVFGSMEVIGNIYDNLELLEV